MNAQEELDELSEKLAKNHAAFCQVKTQVRSDGNKIIVLVRKELEDFWGADQCENDEEIIELIKEDIVAFLENASFIVERSA